MWVCPSCQHRNEGKFCTQCGAIMPDAPSRNETNIPPEKAIIREVPLTTDTKPVTVVNTEASKPVAPANPPKAEPAPTPAVKKPVAPVKKAEPKPKSSKGLIILCIILSIIALSAVGVAVWMYYEGMSSYSYQPVQNDSDVSEAEDTNKDSQISSDTKVEPEAEPEPVKKPKESKYGIIVEDVSWSEAYSRAKDENGYLICINSEEEFERACRLAENFEIVAFWVGAKRYPNDSWYDVTWIDNEPFTYLKWFNGQPSYVDEFDEEETCLMVFKVDGEWYFNDATNERHYPGKIGYIIEVEE